MKPSPFAADTNAGLGRWPAGKSGPTTATSIVDHSGIERSVSVRDHVPARAKHHVHPNAAIV
jgi:hypothetical protein